MYSELNIQEDLTGGGSPAQEQWTPFLLVYPHYIPLQQTSGFQSDLTSPPGNENQTTSLPDIGLGRVQTLLCGEMSGPSTKRHLPRSCFKLPPKCGNTAEATPFSPEHRFSTSPGGMWRGAVVPPSQSSQGLRELSAPPPPQPPGTQARDF